MIRSLCILTLPILTVLGCAQSGQTPVTLHPALLFDANPGGLSGSDIIHQSDWPSTFSQYQYPERLHYIETITDVQGRGRYSTDYTLRRFRLHREGYAIK